MMHPRPATASLLTVLAVALAGCSALQPANVAPMAVYRLDAVAPGSSPAPATATASILVGSIRAAAGFDTSRMLYTRQSYQVEEFQQSQWQKPPAVMLMPLVATALESSGVFKVVLQAPSAVLTTYRLDLEIVNLQQDFGTTPSHLNFKLRAHLSSRQNQQIIAWREFGVSIPTATEDAYGGVVATNQAVAQVLQQLRAFCVDQITQSAQARKKQP
ncbi:ABC-type transport auxiliary lipoprotein family protein [Undibacterium pigrum]|uniref:Cholesterol transport system auxiliary component n=1 Tax=Undibacterium pigrum TaxID=401470 RepID=A0A318INZ8_9BURK|nr:ABC-type transport auxiliary lipoprotein family protein [Undibacterium pigrum]PXX37766.1 cholesterol transport system auxiliary component [Undibacterium pigrum]